MKIPNNHKKLILQAITDVYKNSSYHYKNKNKFKGRRKDLPLNTVLFDGTNDTITLDVDDGYGLGPVNTGHYFELAADGGAHDFTIEGWIYKTSTTKDAWFSQRNSSTVELTIMLDADASGYSAGDVDIEYV